MNHRNLRGFESPLWQQPAAGEKSVEEIDALILKPTLTDAEAHHLAVLAANLTWTQQAVIDRETWLLASGSKGNKA